MNIPSPSTRTALDEAPWTSQSGSAFREELGSRFDQSLATSTRTSELVAIGFTGVAGVPQFVDQLIADAAAKVGRTPLNVQDAILLIQDTSPEQIRAQVSSLAIVVNENDRPETLNMVMAAAEKYDVPLVARFSREESVTGALKKRANLMVLCAAGRVRTGNPAFEERTNYHLSASPSGELLVRKQEVRTPPPAPNVMDLLDKRRQASPDSEAAPVAPSIHSLK